MSTKNDKTTEPTPESDDARDAQVTAGADRPPTAEEEAVAERVAATVDPEAKEHFEEMAKLGANVRGEGQIEP
jgi:hypothetical protein